MKKILLTSVALSLACAINAQVLTLDSCLQMALRNNSEIKASHTRIQEQEYTEKAYKANYYPNISANATYLNVFNTFDLTADLSYFVPNGLRASLFEFRDALAGAIQQSNPELAKTVSQMDGKVSMEYKLNNIVNVGLSLKQPIYMGGKITAAYNMSKIGTKMARMNEQLTREQVIVKTTEAYALLVKAKEMHKVAVKYDSLLSQLLDNVESAKRHGLRGSNDVLKVKVKKNESELQIVQAQNGIELARMNLCHCIGISLNTTIDIKGIGSCDLKTSDANAMVISRPEYNLLEMKNEMAREKIKLARSEFRPQLGVQLSTSYTHGGEILGATLFNSNYPTTMGIVSLTVPIWHGNEAKNKVNAAKKEYERTQQEQQDLVEKMNLELKQCANILDESIVELELANRSVEQAEENLRNSRKSFDVGLETLTDLLEAQTLWQQACAKRAIAESQITVNRVKYRKASGGF